MKKIITLLPLLICVLMLIFTGCAEQSFDDDTTVGESISDDTANALAPIYSAVVDRIPTEEELIHRSSRAISIPTLKPNEKLIHMWVKTHDVKHAGTDDPAYFRANWYTPNIDGTSNYYFYWRNLLLDDPKRNDNERGSYNYFVYHFNVDEFFRRDIKEDRLLSAYAWMKGTDGWKCDYIQVVEENYKGQTRSNRFVFDMWLDNNGWSGEIPSKNRTLLSN